VIRTDQLFGKVFSKTLSMKCDLKSAQPFPFDGNSPLLPPKNESCDIMDTNIEIILKWNKNEFSILDSTFNISNFLHFMDYFLYYVYVDIMNLRGFDINLIGGNFLSASLIQYSSVMIPNSWIESLKIANSDVSFYIGKEKIKSCQDFHDKNVSSINSIFQIKQYDGIISFLLINCEFKEKVCPLVFNNSVISSLIINNLANTFFKKNLLQFDNSLFNRVNSHIDALILDNVQNIDLDTNLLNPSVFKSIISLTVYGDVNSVKNYLFDQYLNLFRIGFQIAHVRKMFHKNGIQWIKTINYNLHVNLSNPDHLDKSFKITFGCGENNDERISKVFPDEDFCVYKDFPFNQLVFIFQFCLFSVEIKENKLMNSKLTCTYLWLTQYSNIFLQYLANDSNYYKSILMIVESDSYKSISKCNFNQRLEFCNKIHFQTKDIWSLSDYFILNKILQIVIKISIYIVSFFGIVTNIVVIKVIVDKKNKELFKNVRQYTFLALNSIFNLFILIIQILSWINECSYPYEVFCPEIRKLVAIQFFKILFKECLVSAFRFMCNFCYIAFALNRISLIGQDHGKLVKFMSEVGIKKYLGVSLFISIGLSVIKFFKYTVNYEADETNFPLSNEYDIFNYYIDKPSFLEAYLIVNSISDILNYIVYVIICLIIDIFMVVKLRSVLEDKKLKSKVLKNSSLNNQQNKDSEEAISKAIKMVILNTAINLLFKIPISILPTLNVYAQFYFKKKNFLYEKPAFEEFYFWLIDSGSFGMIEDLSDLLNCFSISIQFFIYKRFDTKFRNGFLVLSKKAIKNQSSKK